jgi:hypothetical protein
MKNGRVVAIVCFELKVDNPVFSHEALYLKAQVNTLAACGWPMFHWGAPEKQRPTCKIIQGVTAPGVWPSCRLEYRSNVSVEPSQSTYCIGHCSRIIISGCSMVTESSLVAVVEFVVLLLYLMAAIATLLGPFAYATPTPHEAMKLYGK